MELHRLPLKHSCLAFRLAGCLVLVLLVCALAAPVITAAPPSPDQPEPAGTEQARPAIIYVPDTQTIEVRGVGSRVTLSDISAALKDNSLLERTGPYEWYLKVNLYAFEEVTLRLYGQKAGGDVNWLKLKSGSAGFVSLQSSNGSIEIRNTRITSWDLQKNDFDTDSQDGGGRAYVSVKNRSSLYTDNHMDVVDSEIAYLGFGEETAYGISWKVITNEAAPNTGIPGKGMTGKVTGSQFHDNYFGLYLWGTGDMLFANNEIYNNFLYGFDAHTGTQRATLEDNYSHDNGWHGIIFADRCTFNTVRHNRSINNKGHGIMLHEHSTDNLVVNNEVSGNDDGIPLFESSNNTITNNIIRNNTTGVRVYGRATDSAGNLFENNEISGNSTFGVYVYQKATLNTFRNNRIINQGTFGVFLEGALGNIFVDNQISNNQDGVRVDSPGKGEIPSSGNQFTHNLIQQNIQYGVDSLPPESSNLFSDNQFSGNGRGDFRFGGPLPSPAKGGTGLLPLLFVLAIVAIGLATVGVILARRYSPKWRS